VPANWLWPLQRWKPMVENQADGERHIADQLENTLISITTPTIIMTRTMLPEDRSRFHGRVPHPLLHASTAARESEYAEQHGPFPRLDEDPQIVAELVVEGALAVSARLPANR